MKRLLGLAAALLAGWAQAQDVEITSTPSPAAFFGQRVVDGNLTIRGPDTLVCLGTEVVTGDLVITDGAVVAQATALPLSNPGLVTLCAGIFSPPLLVGGNMLVSNGATFVDERPNPFGGLTVTGNFVVDGVAGSTFSLPSTSFPRPTMW